MQSLSRNPSCARGRGGPRPPRRFDLQCYLASFLDFTALSYASCISWSASRAGTPFTDAASTAVCVASPISGNRVSLGCACGARDYIQS